MRHGHVCVDFATLESLTSGEETVRLPWSTGELDRLLTSLRSCDAVGGPGERAAAPLVLEGTRLYLERYYRHEVRLAEHIRSRLQPHAAPLDETRLEDGLLRLFPRDGATDQRPGDQCRAAARAVRERFFVLTGGPGTGKTSTVVKILALLLEQAPGKPWRIDLLGPTGKAAQRLLDAVERAKADLPCDDRVKAGIPSEAFTLHRRLGFRHGRVEHHAENPLSTDLVVVDEASMVDLLWMTRLLDAVPQEARILLLGDQDQLASVEAGTVLGDICGAGVEKGRSAPSRRKPRRAASTNQLAFAFGEATQQAAPPLKPHALPTISRCIAELTTSYRYESGSGIALLAAAIQTGRTDEALALLEQPLDDVVRLDTDKGHSLSPSLLTLCTERFGQVLGQTNPADQLTALERFRVLCAHRRGPGGVETANQAIERTLLEGGLLSHVSLRHYVGRPILVTRNDYDLGLFNGDVGLIVEAEGELRAAFSDPAEGIRLIYPARLDGVETMFAMSIHKSQGSEMDEVAIVLPPEPSALLTRELLYTAVTRAKKRVYLCGSDHVIRTAIDRRVERASGLGERLWRPTTPGLPGAVDKV